MTGVAAELQGLIDEQYALHVGNADGVLADYIPELAKVPPDQFAIAMATYQGQIFSAGDTGVEFTIQSVSKVFTFAMLLEIAGRAETYRAVNVQPSADPFNAILLDPKNNRPFNPMVNAGAIAVAGRLRQDLGKSAFDEVLKTFERAAGRKLEVDDAVFQSERDTGHRNRAIGHLLRAVDVFDVPVDEVLDLYFRQCSIKVTAIDLAVMGATLANLGTNPLTADDVFHLDATRDTLSIMFTCGMYDGAGDWSINVGLPAKSGVGGGIMGVVNRQAGIGVFSPRLDENGNSVRGKFSCMGLAEQIGLHAFDPTNPGSTYLRRLTAPRR
ncbi:MAG: glutaminase A [Acetobacteraceae bacterium]